MKRLNLLLLATLMIFALGVTSCGDDEEAGPTANIEDFLGTYTATDDCLNDEYEVVITKSGDKVNINNLGGLAGTVEATLSGMSLNIASQNGDILGLTQISGTATLDSDKTQLTLSYSTSVFGLASINCKGTAGKN
ncbi:hypothetical protein QQ008_05755 [Fulvivirgaceae bacterium BMA10]|uniref:Lipocalin-like domain-containing protein n=1 Tax=Splendidivirga corallicola TaxID=3051826 RepID=A0ABT8KLE7_9BACT|nr:hypothetical protein [Fulvivirgaceae bacterium BMA10]